MKAQVLLMCVAVISCGMWRGDAGEVDGGNWETKRVLRLSDGNEIHGSKKQLEREEAIKKEKPTSQRAGLVLHEMSLVVKNESMTQKVNGAIIECLSRVTWTEAENWGLYNTSKFAKKMIQAEYFAKVKIEDALEFRMNITRYMEQKKLATCVREKYTGMNAKGDVFYARKVIESYPNGERSQGGIKSWIIGVIVGVVMLLGMVMGVVVMVRKTRVYDPIVFEQLEQHQNEVDQRVAQDMEERRHLEALAVGYN